ncbi:flagellar biosynthetic protein FliR [Geobacillus thermodenitrificans]|jgi:flagellar biosynthesis protein FliR|uniref:flagellar biosynthetic protein FliR n=1 Tax=Geobacillus thermodenitrificans TaxID=33940 RepID=UPI00017E3E35|nr:flagellar biosynthetic protein FliR [Geobacillus thermodenitrificans]ARA97151.1 flagellar biosynthetic protein FliR [Geobacillus thermodenitrificans]MED3905609.1 flagellar biosynthetic protein FliR [Geobacillus thermodenitrificans]PJW21178.1 flagellar type III secretion system protein FliR [Geobacillus thermodenitrificans]
MEQLWTHFPAFLLIFARIASFFAAMPLFSYRTVPASYKIGLAFFFSWILFLAVPKPTLSLNDVYMLLVFKEVLVGLALGLLAATIMAAVQIAGGLIDFQIGFAIANVIDPQTGAQSPLLGQYLHSLALLLLLALDGHHLLLDGMFYSYQWLPLDGWPHIADGRAVDYAVRAFAAMFVVAVQMAAPLVGSLFLVDVALGIIARAVPQMNIFAVGFSLKTVTAFLLLFAAIGGILFSARELFQLMFASLREFMRLLGGA